MEQDTRAPEVRGYSALNERPSLLARALALLTDLALFFLGAGASWFLVERFRLAVSLNILLLLLVLWMFGAWLAIRLVLRVTLGQRIWGLTRSEGKLLQGERVTAVFAARATFLTVAFVMTGAALSLSASQRNPSLRQASDSALEPFLPGGPEETVAASWRVAPFFYALGPWPSRIEDHPVPFTLPYEKGPPNRFVGHIVAGWDPPGIRLVFEGPRTPSSAGAPTASSGVLRERVRQCLAHVWPFGGGNPLRCLAIREETIRRHVAEMNETIHPDHWVLRWFRVRNPAIPPEEQPQGIYLAGENESIAQERYILVNTRGAHQAMILERPAGEKSDWAARLLAQIIRAQRLTSDLDPGRSWADRELSTVRLETLQNIVDPDEFIARLSDVQLLLLAKISVDPRSFDAFYHLAGTGSLLARRTEQLRIPDWPAVGKSLIQSAVRYAEDVAPTEPRLPKMREMRAEK